MAVYMTRVAHQILSIPPPLTPLVTFRYSAVASKVIAKRAAIIFPCLYWLRYRVFSHPIGFAFSATDMRVTGRSNYHADHSAQV